jgi:hypothetical protein
MVHRTETPSEKRARLLATIKFLQEPNMSDTKPHIELVEEPEPPKWNPGQRQRIKGIIQDVKYGIDLAYEPSIPPIYNTVTPLKGIGDFMIEPKPNSLSELCTPPYSLFWRIYNRIAGTTDCSCCVFWRGFILSTMLWWWVGILITIGFLIFGK